MSLAKNGGCRELPPDAAHLVDYFLGIIDGFACYARTGLVVWIGNALMMSVVSRLLLLRKEAYPFALHLAADASSHLSGFAGLLSLRGR